MHLFNISKESDLRSVGGFATSSLMILYRETWSKALSDTSLKLLAVVFALAMGSALGGAVGSARADGRVVISEVLYDSESPGGSEFIEVQNTSAKMVNLSGWQLAGGVRFVFPKGAVVRPRAFAVVTGNADLFENEFGVAPVGEWAGRLGDEGEEVRLLDATPARVDEVRYRSGFPWPVVESGNSIELLHPEMDNNTGGSWRECSSEAGATPGQRNHRSLMFSIPIVESVEHHPRQPSSEEPLKVRAEVNGGGNGVQSVELLYQVVSPGEFLPARLAQDRIDLRTLGRAEIELNPEFEAEHAWSRLPMRRNESGHYLAEIPSQAHRSLVRYRVFVTAAGGAIVRAPLEGDPSLNFAAYVSDGVPNYHAEESSNGGARTHRSKDLARLPVYSLVTRAEDYSDCIAYKRRERLRKGSGASRAYNWEGAFVYDGIVYDHIRYRLRGGNGRYLGHGKRSMKFRFNKGRHLEVRNQLGKKYTRRWRVLECSKMFSNRMVGNFGLVDGMNGRLWRMVGVPAPHTHWFHYRVVDGAEEAPDQWSGDFHGLLLAQERYDGRFLDEHGLEKGNLYKLSDGVWDPESQIRYRAPDAVQDYSDYDAIEGMSDRNSTAWIRSKVDIDKWTRFSVVKEAVRHYDFWPGANKNMAYYFAPGNEAAPGSRLWLLPYDHDDTWGPCWNHGQDVVTRAVYDKSAILLEERNFCREFRDLLWQSDQLNPMIDDLARVIEDMVEADYDRWWRAPFEQGRERFGKLHEKVADMKQFAWYGGQWHGGSVIEGGRARYLDDYAHVRGIPDTPTIRYAGGSGYSADGLEFLSSEFVSSVEDSFGAMQWRLAVITPPWEKVDPFKEERKYEWDADWVSSVSMEFEPAIEVPLGVVKGGDLCRVRVRHQDVTGRWSHWSTAIEFSASAPSVPSPRGLVVSEIHYHPAVATAEETAAGYSGKDFEWLEILNTDSREARLDGIRISNGVDFSFPSGRRLAPSERALVVRNLKAFRLRHRKTVEPIGEWEGGDGLDDGGERLRVKGAAGEVLFEVKYDDKAPWPAEPDGGGASLVLDEKGSPEEAGDFSEASLWRVGPMGGTPGKP
jgi:hypothetical protein